MAQREFDISNQQDVEDLFNLLPDCVNWIAQDADKEIYTYKNKPRMSNLDGYIGEKYIDSLNCCLLKIKFPSEDWKRCTVQRPINYEKYIGKLVWFYNDGADEKRVGELRHIDAVEKAFSGGFGWYENFSTLTLDEIKELTDYE